MTFLNFIVQAIAMLTIHLSFKKVAVLYENDLQRGEIVADCDHNTETIKLLDKLKEGVVIFDESTHDIYYSNLAVKQLEIDGSLSLSQSRGSDFWSQQKQFAMIKKEVFIDMIVDVNRTVSTLRDVEFCWSLKEILAANLDLEEVLFKVKEPEKSVRSSEGA